MKESKRCFRAVFMQGSEDQSQEGDRELRSGCLAVMAVVLRRFPGAVEWRPFWPRFFAAAAPLMPRLVVEVGRPTLQTLNPKP